MSSAVMRLKRVKQKRAASRTYFNRKRLTHLISESPKKLSKESLRSTSQTQNESRSNKQTRLGSLVETLTDVFVGYSMALGANAIIFPLFGFPVSLSQNMIIVATFTILSIIRKFIIRRIFENFK